MSFTLHTKRPCPRLALSACTRYISGCWRLGVTVFLPSQTHVPVVKEMHIHVQSVPCVLAADDPLGLPMEYRRPTSMNPNRSKKPCYGTLSNPGRSHCYSPARPCPMGQGSHDRGLLGSDHQARQNPVLSHQTYHGSRSPKNHSPTRHPKRKPFLLQRHG